MTVVYDLSKDVARIETIQQATLDTAEYGIQQTHGLFGSELWWAKIQSGVLRTHILKGTISRVYMGSMGDWPEFEVVDGAGNRSQWTREANDPADDALYQAGKAVEIAYVIQWHKEVAWSADTETKCVIRIRISE